MKCGQWEEPLPIGQPATIQDPLTLTMTTDHRPYFLFLICKPMPSELPSSFSLPQLLLWLLLLFTLLDFSSSNYFVCKPLKIGPHPPLNQLSNYPTRPQIEKLLASSGYFHWAHIHLSIGPYDRHQTFNIRLQGLFLLPTAPVYFKWRNKSVLQKKHAAASLSLNRPL